MNDPQRWFSSWQRQRIWITAGGRCELCSVPLHYWTFHCDHIWPWSKGGQTVLRNAQALCADCNLTKSNHMDLHPYFGSIKDPRRWQLNFLEKFTSMTNELCGNPERGFLLYATPGAGKTVAMLAASNWLHQAGLIEWTVIVVPSAPLCSQVAREAKTLFGIDLRSGSDGADSQFRGEVVTIQSLAHRVYPKDHPKAGQPDTRPIERRNRNVLLVVDEFHHPSSKNSWGEDIANTLGGCRFKLFCTGTPFRTDRSELRFVNYKTNVDGELELLPDFSYDYGKALADSTFTKLPDEKTISTPSHKRIVRTAKFHLYDAEDDQLIRWADNGEVYEHKLSDHLPSIYDADCDEDAEKGLSVKVKKMRSMRFDAATEPKFDLARRMIRDAVRQLDRVRQTHGHAGGLVVCKKKKHAEQVAEYMRKELGVDPEVIYEGSDGGTSPTQIKDFRRHDCPKKWVVAVQQVSEGVDIKRLRVCVWLTNKKSHLLFLQILGRIIRWEHTTIGERQITPELDQLAHMFMPAQGADTLDKDDPIELVKYAKEIEESIRLVVEPPEEKKCGLCGDRPAKFGCGNCVNSPECPLFKGVCPVCNQQPCVCPKPERELLGAGGSVVDALLRGEFWDPEVLALLEEEAARCGLPVEVFLAYHRNQTHDGFARVKKIAEKASASDVKSERVAKRTGQSAEEVDEMTISEQLEKLKRTVQQKVGQLGMAIARAQGWSDGDTRRQNIHMKIHKRWIRVGGRKADDATVGDLTSKIDWLDDQLVKVTANNIDEDFTHD